MLCPFPLLFIIFTAFSLSAVSAPFLFLYCFVLLRFYRFCIFSVYSLFTAFAILPLLLFCPLHLLLHFTAFSFSADFYYRLFKLLSAYAFPAAFAADRNTVADRQDCRDQLLMVRQLIQIHAHTLMYRTIAADDRIAGFYNIPVL